MSVFLNYEGVKGESSDSAHKDWIDVESWDWGVERKITSNTSTKGDRESSNATIRSLKITKRMDSSTPKLFLESCCGTGKNLTLHLTKTGSGSGTDVYMEFNLKNVLIEQLDFSGKAQGTHRPLEVITFSFVDVEVKYTPYNEDGVAESPIAVGFDTATNIKR